jgi:hypothetical protein
VRSPNQYAGVAWTIYSPQWDLIGIYLFHCFLLCVLLAATLIRRDGLPIPKRLTALAYGVGLSLPAIWPWLRPVPWSLPQPDWMPSSTVALGLETGVAGLLVGGTLAAAISAATPRRGQSRSLAMENATIGTGLVGLFLGWQAVISIALVDGMLAVMLVAARRVKRVATSDNGALSCLLLATLLHLVLWRTSSRFTTWWPGPYSPLWVHGICAALAVTLGWVARRGTQ